MISIITCTADRPLPFALCQLWGSRALAYFERKHPRERIEWIVCDNGEQPAECLCGQIHIKRKPCARPLDSFATNLLTGLCAARGEAILFLEDDDYYAEDYVARMFAELKGHDLVAPAKPKYYAPLVRGYQEFTSDQYMSLARSACSKQAAALLKAIVKGFRDCFFDRRLWSAVRNRAVFESDAVLQVGIKGLPGKRGFETQHEERHVWPLTDSDGSVLKSWIGEEDANEYLGIGVIVQ